MDWFEDENRFVVLIYIKQSMVFEVVIIWFVEYYFFLYKYVEHFSFQDLAEGTHAGVDSR